MSASDINVFQSFLKWLLLIRDMAFHCTLHGKPFQTTWAWMKKLQSP